MDKILYEDIKSFISEEIGLSKEKLNLNTNVCETVDGADGWEFIEAFSEKFGVDMSEFETNRYFGPEAGCNPVIYLYCILFAPDKLYRVPITLGDLVAAAENKKWPASKLKS